MTKLRNKGLTGAVLVAVLMAGSLQGLGAGTDSAVALETQPAVAESHVIRGQGWKEVLACAGCLVGSVAASVVSAGLGAGTAMACGVYCALSLGDED